MKGLYRTANRCRDGLYIGIKSAVLVCLFSGIINMAIAQTAVQPSTLSHLNYDVQPLSIGDKVPDITFHNVLNYKSKTAKLSDFKGKLVILDMWSVFCTSCIAGFPKMEQLQKEFGDKIQVLLVNPHDAKYDSEEKIVETLNKFKTRTGFYPSLPVPIHDSILNRYFPHESVPHTVWIDGNKNVIAITGSNDVKAENIRKILAGEKLVIAVKNDWAFDKEKPLLIEANGGQITDFIFRSVFTSYKNGIGFGSGIRINNDRKATGIYMLNKPLIQYVGEAFSDVLRDIRPNRIIIDSENPEKFKWELDTNNTFCYDLTIPPIELEKLNIKEYLQNDLKHAFNISVHREERKVRCLIIYSTNKLKSIAKYNQKSVDLEFNTIQKYIRNYPVQNVVEFLDRFEKPIIIETEAKGNIDIEFPTYADLSDVKVVLQALRNAGLEIMEEERIIEVAIITDKIK